MRKLKAIKQYTRLMWTIADLQAWVFPVIYGLVVSALYAWWEASMCSKKTADALTDRLARSERAADDLNTRLARAEKTIDSLLTQTMWNKMSVNGHSRRITALERHTDIPRRDFGWEKRRQEA